MQMAELQISIGSINGMFHTSEWPEAKAVIAEFGFTDRFHDLFDTLLYQSIPYTGDSKRSCRAVGFGYIFPSYGFWPVAMFTAS